MRVNTAMGIRAYRQARFAAAEQFFRKALDRLTDKYTTPKDAEATYYLGLTLKAQGSNDEAYDALYKATWSLPWRAAAYFEAAEIAAARGDLAASADLVERSLQANAWNVRALTLKAALLRNLGHPNDALDVLAAARRVTDPLDVRLMAEQWLITRTPADAAPLLAAMKAFPATAEETAAEYLRAGLWKDGTAVLTALTPAPSPLVDYYLAYFAGKLGQPAKAAEYDALAMKLPPDYVFPFQYEAIEVLRQAIAVNPRDARAPYYLGNLLYDWQPDEAVKYWEASAALDPAFAVVQRNLATAWTHRPDGATHAIALLEKAVSLDRKYPLHFTQLDELYETAAVAPEKRLALLEQNHAVVTRRDDSLAREITLKVVMGKYDDAITLMTGRRFAVWEGANLNVADDWTSAHLLRGQQQLAAGRAREALADFQRATQIPDNLPAGGRGGGDRSVEAAYCTGAAYEALGDAGHAKEAWTRAATPLNTGGRGGRGPRAASHEPRAILLPRTRAAKAGPRRRSPYRPAGTRQIVRPPAGTRQIVPPTRRSGRQPPTTRQDSPT